MTGETAVTGELGKAVVTGDLIARITSWRINPSVGESAWGDSDSAGYTNRKAGRKDLTGTISGKFDSDSPFYNVFREGDIVELVLWETATRYWALPSSLIQGFELEYDVDGKTVVGWSAPFGADGIYYAPGQSGAPAETLPS